MITGDYPNTARAIAESIGLLKRGRKVATGAELEAMSAAKLKREIEKTDVFARVSPEHKLRIVDALQDVRKVLTQDQWLKLPPEVTNPFARRRQAN